MRFTNYLQAVTFGINRLILTRLICSVKFEPQRFVIELAPDGVLSLTSSWIDGEPQPVPLGRGCIIYGYSQRSTLPSMKEKYTALSDLAVCFERWIAPTHISAN